MLCESVMLCESIARGMDRKAAQMSFVARHASQRRSVVLSNEMLLLETVPCNEVKSEEIDRVAVLKRIAARGTEGSSGESLEPFPLQPAAVSTATC